MRIGNREVNFVYEYPWLLGTEQYLMDTVLKKITDAGIPIPGDEKINFFVYGYWNLVQQISQKELDLRSVRDVPGQITLIESCFKCDDYCSNCPLVNCSERTCECKLPRFEIVKL